MQNSVPAVDLTGEHSDAPLPDRFDNAKAWTGPDLTPDDWTVTLPDEAVEELRRAVARLRLQNLPVYMLSPAQFEFQAVRQAMAEARRRALDGRGLAIVDRLPFDDWSLDEAKAAVWLVLSCVSPPVAQAANGMIFRDIVNAPNPDRDKSFDKGQGVTQERLTPHTDNSSNRNLPNFSTLTCVYGAREGGLSEYCTIYSLYNAMKKEAPQQLERLFRPYYHDRQKNQPPGEPELIRVPAITYDGERLLSRISVNKIFSGYNIAGQELDNLGRDALETAIDIVEKRNLSARYMLERGQVLIFNNREGLHHRQQFENGDTVETQRHLIRVWMRDEGEPFFDG